VSAHTFVNYANIVRFNPSQPTQYFTLNVQAWQNSGGNLGVQCRLTLFKLPIV
jgi:hypothetical protein